MNTEVSLKRNSSTLITTSFFFYLCLILCLLYDILFDTLLADALNLYIYVGVLDLLLPGIAVWGLISSYRNKTERTAAFLIFLFFLFAKTLEARVLLSTFTYKSAYTIVCLMVASKGHEFRKIAKVYIVVNAVILTSVALLALTGVIPDLLFEEAGRPDRHSLGFTYPLYCSAHWFTLALVYCYVRKGILKVWDYALLIGVWAMLFFLCKAQTASALLILLMFGTFIRQVYRYRLHSKSLTPSPRFLVIRDKLMSVMRMSFLLMMVLMIGGALLYVPPVSDFIKDHIGLSTMFSRLAYGRVGLLNFIPTIFGRSFDYNTWVGTVKADDYFSIDSSYILIPIYFGVIGTPIIMYGLKYIPDKVYRNREGYTLFLLSLFAVLCTMEHRLFYVSYSIFWLMAFANLNAVSHERRV